MIKQTANQEKGFDGSIPNGNSFVLYTTAEWLTTYNLTSINLQKKNLKNPGFKSLFIFLDVY